MQSRTTDEAGRADQERHLNHGRQWANREIQIDRRQLLMRRSQASTRVEHKVHNKRFPVRRADSCRTGCTITIRPC